MDAMVIAEIKMDALRQNLAAIRSRLPGRVFVCPAVKANAYGHGLEIVTQALQAADVRRAAVANLAEALELRRLGWTGSILCFGPALAQCPASAGDECSAAIVEADVTVTVTSWAEAEALARAAERSGRRGRVEVKVDSGMGRMGLPPQGAYELIRRIAGHPSLEPAGVYTHLATADEEDLAFAHQQLQVFAALRERLRADGIATGCCHAANSAAIFRLPAAHLDGVRPGLALYGYWAGPAGERPADLRPSLRICTRLTAVRPMPADASVGYGCTFRTGRPSTIGVVPLGYADGYRRSLSNRTVMTLDSCRGQPRRIVPVVGRISMDQTTLDLTDAGDVRVGDPVVVIDDDPAAPNNVESLARLLDTIPYEITCLLGPRVRRVAV